MLKTSCSHRHLILLGPSGKRVVTMKSKEVTGWVRAPHPHAFEEEQDGFSNSYKHHLYTLDGFAGCWTPEDSARWSEEKQVPFLYLLAPHLEPAGNAVWGLMPSPTVGWLRMCA